MCLLSARAWAFMVQMLNNAIAQVNGHLYGGATELSWDDTLSLVSTLMSRDRSLSDLEERVNAARDSMQRLEEEAQNMRVPSQSQLENDIWVLWISQLSDPNMLDNDEIEDYLHSDSVRVLGPSSLLGVDFGTHWYSWTSSADENAAISAARQYRDRLQQQGQVEHEGRER